MWRAHETLKASESKQQFKALRHHQVATGTTQLCTKASTDNMKKKKENK